MGEREGMVEREKEKVGERKRDWGESVWGEREWRERESRRRHKIKREGVQMK